VSENENDAMRHAPCAMRHAMEKIQKKGLNKNSRPEVQFALSRFKIATIPLKIDTVRHSLNMG
jgi:hypothetical protein